MEAGKVIHVSVPKPDPVTGIRPPVEIPSVHVQYGRVDINLEEPVTVHRICGLTASKGSRSFNFCSNNYILFGDSILFGEFFAVPINKKEKNWLFIGASTKISCQSSIYSDPSDVGLGEIIHFDDYKGQQYGRYYNERGYLCNWQFSVDTVQYMRNIMQKQHEELSNPLIYDLMQQELNNVVDEDEENKKICGIEIEIELKQETEFSVAKRFACRRKILNESRPYDKETCLHPLPLWFNQKYIHNYRCVCTK